MSLADSRSSDDYTSQMTIRLQMTICPQMICAFG